jgi:hypothetical protein
MIWWIDLLLCLLSVQTTVSADNAQLERKPFRYNAGRHRDPFIPLVQNGRPTGVIPGRGSDGSSTSPRLHGILWDPGGASLALINDGEFKVGDTVGGYRVAEIRQDAVVLTNGGEPLVLQISFEAPSDDSTDTTTGGEAP